jgi:hypothetical protein
MKVKRSRKIAALVTISLFPAMVETDAVEWTRFFVVSSSQDSRPFGFVCIQEDPARGLSATAWYRYIEGRKPAVLHGKKEPNGDFQPIAKYEVAVEGKTKWKEVPAKFEQTSSDSITVNPEHSNFRLSLNLEPFRAAIGVYTYARVVLENGDSVTFEIDNLLPTEDQSGSGKGDFKTTNVLQSAEEKKKNGFSDKWMAEPGDLVSVTSFGGRIIGYFVFGNRSHTVQQLEGSRTLDGEFWPKATLQVANSDHDWTTIGSSQNHGSPEMLSIPSRGAEGLRVLLTDFRDVIGKYKYGKNRVLESKICCFSYRSSNRRGGETGGPIGVGPIESQKERVLTICALIATTAPRMLPAGCRQR